MNSDRRKEIEEVERALEILRGRKANFDRANRTFSYLLAPIAGLLLFIVPLGILRGEIGLWAVLPAGLFIGLLYLSYRMLYPKDVTPIDWLSGRIGYRRSDGAILDEQIAAYQGRLESLRSDTRE